MAHVGIYGRGEARYRAPPTDGEAATVTIAVNVQAMDGSVFAADRIRSMRGVLRTNGASIK